MVDPEDPHVGAATGAALLDHVRGGVVEAHKGNGTAGHAHGGADNRVLRPEPGEPEAGAAAGLVNQCHRPQGVVDPVPAIGEGVFDRQHEAGGKLAERTAGVHQGGGVRHELPVGHQSEERLGEGFDRADRGAVAPIRLGDGAGDAPEEVGRGFDRLPLVVFDEISLLQHREGVGGKIECVSSVRGIRHDPSLERGESK